MTGKVDGTLAARIRAACETHPHYLVDAIVRIESATPPEVARIMGFQPTATKFTMMVAKVVGIELAPGAPRFIAGDKTVGLPGDKSTSFHITEILHAPNAPRSGFQET